MGDGQKPPNPNSRNTQRGSGRRSSCCLKAAKRTSALLDRARRASAFSAEPTKRRSDGWTDGQGTGADFAYGRLRSPWNLILIVELMTERVFPEPRSFDHASAWPKPGGRVSFARPSIGGSVLSLEASLLPELLFCLSPPEHLVGTGGICSGEKSRRRFCSLRATERLHARSSALPTLRARGRRPNLLEFRAITFLCARFWAVRTE